jgi:pyrroline-5-carboxylate reductase
MKLTFIGNGNMAKSLIQGLVSSYDIEVLGRNKNSLKELQKEIPNITINELKDNNDISNKNIILCVKPNSLKNLSENIIGKAKSLFSVLAGTTLESLQNNIASQSYIRTMPNLGATYGKSMTTITGDEHIKQDALDIFNSIGKTLWLNTQKELDIATGLAGSGPAYLSLVAEALADGAVNSGLKREDASYLTAGLFEGFAALIQNDTPANIKDGVMSPGGTTAAGYAALEKQSVRSAMIDAINAAYSKAIELGKK